MVIIGTRERAPFFTVGKKIRRNGFDRIYMIHMMAKQEDWLDRIYMIHMIAKQEDWLDRIYMIHMIGKQKDLPVPPC
jgi:hypothetical protein